MFLAVLFDGENVDSVLIILGLNYLYRLLKSWKFSTYMIFYAVFEMLISSNMLIFPPLVFSNWFPSYFTFSKRNQKQHYIFSLKEGKSGMAFLYKCKL